MRRVFKAGWHSAAAIGAVVLTLAGCGTVVPRTAEPWEDNHIAQNYDYIVKSSIFCELVAAVRYVNKNLDNRVDGKKFLAIPNDYGVQMEIDLTSDENTAFNPALSLNRTLPNAHPLGITVGQMFNLTGAATVSAGATRTDTLYSFYNIGKISNDANVTYCKNRLIETASSPLAASDLRIREYLVSAVAATNAIPSSDAPGSKSGINSLSKLDIYTFIVKFVITTTGSINPVWKLVNITGNAGNLPLVSSGRIRTHTLTLTFGPSAAQGLRPSYESVQSHFNQQIIQSNAQRRADQIFQ